MGTEKKCWKNRLGLNICLPPCNSDSKNVCGIWQEWHRYHCNSYDASVLVCWIRFQLPRWTEWKKHQSKKNHIIPSSYWIHRLRIIHARSTRWPSIWVQRLPKLPPPKIKLFNSARKHLAWHPSGTKDFRFHFGRILHSFIIQSGPHANPIIRRFQHCLQNHLLDDCHFCLQIQVLSCMESRYVEYECNRHYVQWLKRR